MLPLLLLVGLTACLTHAESATNDPPRLHELLLESGALERTLEARIMDLDDLYFVRDVAEPHCSWPITRDVLAHPERLFSVADETVTVLTGGDAAARWKWMARLADMQLDSTSQKTASPPLIPVLFPPELPESLARHLKNYVADVAPALKYLDNAFSEVPLEDRQYAAAVFLVGLLEDDGQPGWAEPLVAAGIPRAILDEVLAENEALDSRPRTDRLLRIIQAVRLDDLLAAGQTIERAVTRLRLDLQDVSDWPDRLHAFDTPVGRIRIGTFANDTHDEPAALILDPGGDDTYRNVGGANGLAGAPLAVLLDLGGDDIYVNKNIPGAGGALWGCAWLDDADGDDSYRASSVAQAAALFGVAGLRDGQGEDLYTASFFAQAASHVGFAVLLDNQGNDNYSIASSGQAYAGVAAVATLMENHGDDLYSAGRVRTDFERHWHRRVSLAQGFATGMRPSAGGGVAVLLDRSGNDSYIADVYGQGVAYWYAIGLLLDLAGHDSYQVYEYGQGSGIHLSSGLLADYAGNDIYYGFSLAQGAAHDYALGCLLDLSGNDAYTADHHSQGCAINNSLALLGDFRGADAYFARDENTTQGIGNFAPIREYGSLAMLLDAANPDSYSSGASNQTDTLRPHFGVIHDLPDDPPIESYAPVDALPAPDFSALSFDDLMRHVGRYGDSEERRVNKSAARAELKRRGGESLKYLLDNINTENMWMGICADDLARELPADVTAPVLLEALQDNANPTNRKFIIYLMGHQSTPQYAADILPGLDDDFTAGVAMRALGKWSITNALDRIVPYLQSTNERQRIMAANALHDIQDDRAASHLVPLLADPYFTVRYSAQRALSNLTAEAVLSRLPPVLESTNQIAQALAEELRQWKQPGE